MRANRPLTAEDCISDPRFRVASHPARIVMTRDVPNKHILDTSAWNALYNDSDRDAIVKKLRSTTIVPTSVAITELAAIENSEKRIAILQFMKTLGKNNRPLATPNQLIIMACQGYSRRDGSVTINAGDDALGGWIALKQPGRVNASAQRIALVANRDREGVLRTFNESLRTNLQPLFVNGVERPRSMAALIRHYAKNDDFLYGVVNPIYERAVGRALPPEELWPLLNSMHYWRMFLAGYVCAIYQRAVKREGYGYGNKPGHLDLWSAAYLPLCEVFVTHDKPQRRALKILNVISGRRARVISYGEWRDTLLRSPA
jgi:hypothetical protein